MDRDDLAADREAEAVSRGGKRRVERSFPADGIEHEVEEAPLKLRLASARP
jgi:hypothetical protein